MAQDVRRRLSFPCTIVSLIAAVSCSGAEIHKEIAEGKNLVLDCSDIVTNTYDIIWYLKEGDKLTILITQTQVKNNPANNTKLKNRVSCTTWGKCELRNISSADPKSYSCKQIVPLQDKANERKFIVDVIEKPSAPSITIKNTQKKYVRENTTVIFKCVPAEKSGRILEYRFKRGYNTITEGINQIDGTLTISKITRKEQGKYTCNIKNIAGNTWSEEVSLDVDYPPTGLIMTGIERDKPLYSGDNKMITCEVKGGQPPPSNISWICPESGFATGYKRVSKFSAVVKKEWNTRTCTCQAIQRARDTPLKTQATLFVYWPPSGPSLKFTPGLPWQEGRKYTVTCQAADPGRPYCTYVWYKGREKISTTHQNIKTVSFVVTKDDNGAEVRCVLENMHTERRPPRHPVEAKKKLNVHYTPKQPHHPPDGERIFTALGKAFHLSIQVDANPANVKFQWFRIRGGKNTTITQSTRTIVIDRSSKSNLTITNSTENDLGRYTVHANNGVLNGSYFHYLVKPQDKPGKPSINSTRCFETPVSVEIWWQAGFDGGYTQTFSVYYRETGTKEYREFQSNIGDPGSKKHSHIRVTGLTSGTKYQFKVVAHNKHTGRSSTESSPVIFKTLERPKVDPSSLKFKRDWRKASLNWQIPTGAFDTQRIVQYEGGKEEDITSCRLPHCLKHENLTQTATSYDVKGLDERKIYVFELVLFYKGDMVERKTFKEELVETGLPALTLVGICLAVLFFILFLVLIFIVLRVRRKSMKDQERISPNPEQRTENITDDSNSGNPLYAEPQKKNKNKAVCKKNHAGQEDTTVVYANVDKKGQAEKDEATASIVYADVVTGTKSTDKKKTAGGKTQLKKHCADSVVYAEVIAGSQKNEVRGKNEGGKKVKRRNGKGKKKNADAGEHEVYENMTAMNKKGGDRTAAHGISKDKTENLEPPPGTDGLQYATVEFIKPKPCMKKTPQTDEATEYAAIDYKKKTTPM